MNTESPRKTIDHYYGDIVRIIFIVGAVFILWGLPRITQIINIPVLFPIFAVTVLGVAAGMTNPLKKISVQINAGVSVVFLVIFAYMSWYCYVNNITNIIELSNQVAAVLFLAASYFSIKSLRATSFTD